MGANADTLGTARPGSLGVWSPHAIVGLLCAGAIVAGWTSREELDLSASDGLGYAMGIIGLSMMVLLLSYSVRKRSRALRRAGPMRTWFEIHLILGLLGPTVILYHAGFEMGSANATVSLVCVLAVAGSGVGGRFLYGKMHRGLAGERRSSKGFQKQARMALSNGGDRVMRVQAAQSLLSGFEHYAVGGEFGLARSLQGFWLRPFAMLTKLRVRRVLRASGAPETDIQASAGALAEFLHQTCRAGELHLFEQLFALWHAIHIPLTVILFLSAVVHVVAVHLY